ncbi:helix-turn-helix transcriptional regulator [Paraflavisolibacter sp. H34]|uniref:AraC family transcriptional regulator n=1 Tax=Huijunlia imazamoxiresistens TaxID=3127457 RepID=UPI003019BF90
MTSQAPVLHIATTESTVPFEMHTMEWIDRNRAEQNAVPHRHDYYVIVWVRQGSGLHFIDLDKYELSGNTVYCLAPGQVHLLKADPGVDGCVFSFTPEFLCLTEENYNLLFNSGLFYAGDRSAVIPVPADMQQELEDVTRQMLKEYENYFLLRSEILRGYLKIFLLYLARQVQQAEKKGLHLRNLEMIRNFFSLLQQHFASKKMVADYAAELAVTPNYLNEIVKKVTGTPASEHIKQRVVLEAKRQAVYTGVSMKEIAYGLGFDDVAHFSKYFKNATGANFTDFKKQADQQFLY